MASNTPRKAPVQARARATVSAILDATAQLLVEEGYHKLSTNRIAERAGVSIGSLYQYFPNKEAIVGGLVEQFAERQYAMFEIQLQLFVDERIENDAEAGIRVLVRALLEAKLVEPDLTRVLFEQLPPIGQRDVVKEWLERAHRAVQLILGQQVTEMGREIDPDLGAFILVNAVHGVIQGAILSRMDLLSSDRLADETSEMVLRYLNLPAAEEVE
jgi:AcrR family transcriptional regulator